MDDKKFHCAALVKMLGIPVAAYVALIVPCLRGGRSFAGRVRIWSRLGDVVVRLRQRVVRRRRAAVRGGIPCSPIGTSPCSSPAASDLPFSRLLAPSRGPSIAKACPLEKHRQNQSPRSGHHLLKSEK